MKKFIIFIVILLVMGLGIFYFLSNKEVETTELNNGIANNITNVVVNNNKVSTSTKSIPSEVSVDIKNFAFSSNTLNIKAGTKVTWTNRDSAPHTITSDAGSLLNSPRLAQGESWSFTFANAGVVKYHCAVHPNMKASVNVEK